MTTTSEAITPIAGKLGNMVKIEEVEGEYKRISKKPGQWGDWELGSISDGKVDISFFLPKERVGKVTNGSTVLLSGVTIECKDYKGKTTYSLYNKDFEVEVTNESLEMETLDGDKIPPAQQMQKSTVVAEPKQITGDRIDMAMFQALSAIDKHKTKIMELQGAKIIEPIDLNALTATVLIDSKK